MKKNVKILGVIAISLMLMTGCGSEKKLVCTDTDGKLTEEITFKFVDDKITNVKMVYTSEQSSKEEAENNKDSLKTFITMNYGTPDHSGYTYESSVSGTKIIGTIDADYSKVTDNFKELISAKSTYEDVKKEYEGNGSTCK